MAWDKACYHTKWHLHPSSHLARIDMDRKKGTAVPPFLGGGQAGSPSNTMRPGPRLTSILSGTLIYLAVWRQQTWAENWWRLFAVGGGGAESSSISMWPGHLRAKFHLDPSTVWPQYTNVTDRQSGQKDRQDNSPVVWRTPKTIHMMLAPVHLTEMLKNH